MTFGAVFPRTLRPAFGPGLAAAGAVPTFWWEAGGATSCVWAYQPKGAASYAASKSNLVSPGTYDATDGVAPAWDTTNGWISDGTKWIRAAGSSTFAIQADQSQTLIVRFSDVTTDPGTLTGSAIGDGNISIASRFFGGKIYNNGAYTYIGSGAVGAGVMAVAGNQGYLNGSADGATFGATGLPVTKAIGMFSNGVGGEKSNGKIQAVAFYSVALSAAEVAAVSAAMAAL